MRRRTAAGFADAHPDAGQEQVQVALHEAADRGHGAPDGQRQGDDVAPIGAVGPARDGNPGAHVEDGEREARKQAELAVGQRQFRLDRLLQDRQELPVDKVEGVDTSQQDQGIPTGRSALVRVVPGAGAVRVAP